VQITQQVEDWFNVNARYLPWRSVDTPWGRLVSEFMAQQTQISRVAERWPLIMKRFPTPKEMAINEENELLLLWQGLGYYRRAKYLKAAAEMIANDFKGEIPSDIDSLLKLPGVGRYTSGAIASIAFHKREPIVDGNVHRVLCRIYNKRDESVAGTWVWNVAKKLVENCDSPATFNEGLMELGATVCLPKSPRCELCPLQNDCEAYSLGSQLEVPAPRKRPKKTEEFHYSVIMQNGENLAFQKRDEGGLWSGMWQVPTVESKRSLNIEEVVKELNLNEKLVQIGSFTHILSHRTIAFTVFSSKSEEDSRFTWINKDALHELPLARAQRKVLAVHCTA